MSRFFAENSDSDSDSSNSENENEVQVDTQGGNRFEFDSSSSEEEKRVVRSARDKRFAAMHTCISAVNNHINNQDWVEINKTFEELNKLLKKAKNIVRREGIPKFYIKSVLSIRTLIESTLADQKDPEKKTTKMNPSNNKAFNTLKQKLKKWDKEYSKAVAAYLKSPLVTEEEKDSEFSDSDDSDDDKVDAKADSKKGDDDGDGDESWDSESSGSDGGSGSDSEDDLIEDMPAGGIQYTRAYWMKKPSDIAKSKAKKEQREQRLKDRKSRKKKKKVTTQVVEKKEEKVYTPEMILKKLKELLSMRGKRGTNRQTMIADLEILSSKATDPAAVLKVQVALASAYFEMNLNKGSHMDLKVWGKCYTVLVNMMNLIKENEFVRLSEDDDVEENFDDDDDDDEGFSSMITGGVEKKKPKKKEEEEKEDDGISYVKGNFYSFLYRLGMEFTKSLQEIDPQTPEYVARLRDEPKMATLCALGADYYKLINKTDYQCQTILIHLELLYYHYYPGYDAALAKNEGTELKSNSTSQTVKLAQFLYGHGDTRQRTRALLAHVYFCAQHNQFARARDLLLMSHVQDNINEADIKTRILFNRTMAQLGLCAFRTGNYGAGMQCLADLFQSQRIKELLAQGISSSKYHERDVKQEKVEKKRQYPFHMHLNLDLLESVHLIGAMFTEVENISSGKRKVVSKIFRRLYDLHNNSVFNAPPENTRDLIMHATKNIRQGYWRPAVKSLLSLRMWSQVRNAENVKSIMTKNVKETSLRMYLLAFGTSYVSISLTSLTDMFELTEAQVFRVTSKMMVQGLLDSVWDQPTKTLVMHATQPSRLQKVALKFADKAVVFVEQNERLLDQRHGYYQGKDNTKRWDRNRGNNNKKGNYHNNNYRNNR